MLGGPGRLAPPDREFWRKGARFPFFQNSFTRGSEAAGVGALYRVGVEFC